MDEAKHMSLTAPSVDTQPGESQHLGIWHSALSTQHAALSTQHSALSQLSIERGGISQDSYRGLWGERELYLHPTRLNDDEDIEQD
jgi:hypothetical protein